MWLPGWTSRRCVCSNRGMSMCRRNLAVAGGFAQGHVPRMLARMSAGCGCQRFPLVPCHQTVCVNFSPRHLLTWPACMYAVLCMLLTPLLLCRVTSHTTALFTLCTQTADELLGWQHYEYVPDGNFHRCVVALLPHGTCTRRGRGGRPPGSRNNNRRLLRLCCGHVS